MLGWQKLATSLGNELLKFIYSEKATKFCEISTLLLPVCTVDKSKVEISQNFVAFSEYTNFNQCNVLSFLYDICIATLGQQPGTI